MLWQSHETHQVEQMDLGVNIERELLESLEITEVETIDEVAVPNVSGTKQPAEPQHSITASRQKKQN